MLHATALHIAKRIGERSHLGPLDCVALARNDVDIFLEIFLPSPPSRDLPRMKAGARRRTRFVRAQPCKSLQKSRRRRCSDRLSGEKSSRNAPKIDRSRPQMASGFDF
jgi:hypothetical protein